MCGVLGCEEVKASGDRGENRKLLDEQNRIYIERVKNNKMLRMMVNRNTECIYTINGKKKEWKYTVRMCNNK